MAKRMKIVTVCGCGLGSSLLAKVSIEKIAREYGVKTTIDAADAGTVKGHRADIIVTTTQLAPRVGKVKDTPVLTVDSFMDKEQLRAVLAPYLERFGTEG